VKINIDLCDTSELEERIAKEVVKAIKPFLADAGQDKNLIFSVEALAGYLGVSNQWVYDRIKSREIPYIKVGKFCRFKKRDIDVWLDNMKVPVVNPYSGKVPDAKRPATTKGGDEKDVQGFLEEYLH